MPLLVLLLGGAVPGTGLSEPPRPPDQERQRLREERAEVRHNADRVRELAVRLAEVESELAGLSAEVESALERANKARVDLRRAERSLTRSEGAARAAEAASELAARRLVRHRERVDEFIEGSYKQGSLVGSIPAFVGADSAGEALDRASLLRALARSQLDVLEELREARIARANRDAATRDAVRTAERKHRAAERARVAAEAARRRAVAARNARRADLAELRAERQRARRRLNAARAEVSTLEERRDRRLRRGRAGADGAPASPGATSSSSGDGTEEPNTSPRVETVVSRALSQRGVTYAWGGGSADGPSRGIRDGGVADAHGDYRKVGFDCSGLMVYAFAGVGIRLPHYSGYQYRAGTRLPLARKQRGDMLFWRDEGGVHHVALYLGDGRMVEAPHSGAHVRVTGVRYSGIAPYVVRLL
ncbi:NlpC/P60 family protein [Actinopolyspora xinjiangensis]|uniref:NlpC/P60 family protein n=1 Tax=Actinopolyspora xinjiangensis TaxID=405564 RepID=UPI00147EA52B|nr:NlpC/P60 family protein [Actinopolyspora xinjiangensis]